MRKNRTGFTLIELLVVVLIVGILSSIGMPYYYKTLEVSKATDAVAMGHMIGNAYRMFKIDNPSFSLEGDVEDSCNTSDCATLVDAASTSACRLVACNYVAKQSWDSASYKFTLDAGGVTADRRDEGTREDYKNWGYYFDATGACAPLADTDPVTPPCPKF